MAVVAGLVLWVLFAQVAVAGDPMSKDNAAHEALSLLGVPEDKHAAIFAIQDQLDAWTRAHPGQDAFASGQCDDLFAAMGRIAMEHVL